MNTLYLMLLSLCWASAFLFVKVADHDCTPLMVVACRSVLGALFLVGVGLVLKKPFFSLARNAKTHGILAVSGLLIGYLWYAIAQSELLLPASVAALMPATSTIFTWSLCVFLLRERQFSWAALCGIFIASLGVATIIGWAHLLESRHVLLSIVLLMSGFFALSLSSILLTTYFSEQDDVYVISTYSVIYAAVISVSLCLFFGGGVLSGHASNVIGALLGVGIISTGLGYLLFFTLSKRAGTVFTSFFGYLVPVFGFLLSTLFLGEVITLTHLFGGAIVLCGVAMINRSFTKSPV